MAELTKDQIGFLKSQGIAPTQVFDASSAGGKTDREATMDALELSFYYGGAACKKGGHTLRTKAGHCIQCDTSKIAYQLRHSAKGYVYLAYAKSNQLVKIGFTKENPLFRLDILRQQGYANAVDWQIVRSARFDSNAGRKEFKMHSLLEQFQESISYEKNKGQLVECREVFSCDLQVAINAFEQVAKEG